MGKRKVFVKAELATIGLEHGNDESGKVVLLPQAIPPRLTTVSFPPNPSNYRTFDFAPWYGVNIDELASACQRQIDRFIGKQDSDIEVATIAGYCNVGLRAFLDYAAMLASAHSRAVQLSDINRATIDGFLRFLRDRGNTGVQTQRTIYSYTKAVLGALGRRGLIAVIDRGDDATFPRGIFPNAHRIDAGERPLSLRERKAFTAAVKTAVLPLFNDEAVAPSKEMLAHAVLVVALHTGRNTTPLLEMAVDALRPHPKDSTEFLVLYKRRGHTSNKVAVRSAIPAGDRSVESMPAVRPTVSRLIRRVIELTSECRKEAPSEIADRVWLYRSSSGVRALCNRRLAEGVAALIRKYGLTDADGKPLRVNVSRLRKTFVNRVNEILDGDIAATAAAAGNLPHNTDRHYLRPGEASTRNWRFMGACLVEELLAATIGATERTPIGQCSDSMEGEYAPKRNGVTCQSFLNCLRCRNYVVTGDDLWRLFSFYWRVLLERSRVDKDRWRQRLAHIPRLIERDVVEAGVARKVFTRRQVDDARERARLDPHPFWATESIISDMETLV